MAESEGESYLDVHDAFAVSRSSEYVYVPGDEDCFQKLDQHAESIEGDAKLPFVILGGPGCGKSALLANWVQRRKQHKHRDEFLFQHFVGCSPKSKQLEHLLFRLESALKDFFQLREMEVPKSEERLRWSLSRFLYSAAKKHIPARIVIVLDGVNKLLGQSAAADAMHWLPTELQPGVRFILSTAEYDKYSPNGAEPPEGARRLHRTWTELNRRRCPYLRMEPLTMDVRHSIIEAFVDKYPESMQLNSTQRFQIATAAASSQPMFLRTVLFALRLGSEMSSASMNDQIDTCLAAESTSELISTVFDLCSGYVEGEDVEGGGQSILCRVLSVLYASRHGLSNEEIRGSVEMAMGAEIPEAVLGSIARILKDFTMMVDGLRMFSHEDYSNAVYDKYVQTPELNIRLHLLMARYFGRLAPCDRKLDSLPYHLEVSGSWSKLKSALVNVEMFELWWTPRHKTEFISLWASLTDCDNPKTPIRKLVSGEFNSTMRCNQPPRPCFDIVEEYVKSVDEYRYVANPAPEVLATVILKIADFMLELATLNLEEQADVPQFIHPHVPKEDFAALGVPYLDTDKDGCSVLRTPVIEGESALGKPVVDAPAKLNEEVPVCSTYFYHRWMWIQFPWVALSNCGDNYSRGIEYSQSLKPPSLRKLDGAQGGASTTGRRTRQRKTIKAESSEAETLPDIRTTTKKREFIKRATLPTPKRREQGESSEDVAETQWADKVKAARMTISNARYELDHMAGERTALVRKISELKDELVDLKRMHFASSDLETRKEALEARFERLDDDKRKTAQLHSNYLSVLRMCERHPAHSQALIDELERKLAIDEKFIDTVRQRLHKEKFEQHMYQIQQKYMSKAIGEASILQHDMLTERQRQAGNLRRLGEMELSQPVPGQLTKSGGTGGEVSERTSERRGTQRQKRGNAAQIRTSQTEHDNQNMLMVARWEEYQQKIHQRTGISDPAEFFEKFLTQDSLAQQMKMMQEAADRRHGKLKADETRVEQELEEARYEAQAAGMNFGEVRKKQELLSKLQFQHQHVKERADAMERLSQAGVSGLKHVCETLGMPPLDSETPLGDLIQAVDGLLDTLMEEKDRAQQKTALEATNSRPASQHKQPAGKSQRATELTAALQHYETPKQRVAARLHGRVGQEQEPTGEAQRPEMDNELLMYRKEVKGAAMKSLKDEKRRQAKAEMKKQAAIKAQMED